MQDTSSGKEYITLKTYTYDHDRGQKQCEENGGILPEPRNAQENEFLNGLNTGMFLLGLTDKEQEGNWVWDSDGTPVNYTNWVNEPFKGEEANCAVMLRNNAQIYDGNQWTDVDCTSKNLGISGHHLIKDIICERGMSCFIYVF